MSFIVFLEWKSEEVNDSARRYLQNKRSLSLSIHPFTVRWGKNGRNRRRHFGTNNHPCLAAWLSTYLNSVCGRFSFPCFLFPVFCLVHLLPWYPREGRLTQADIKANISRFSYPSPWGGTWEWNKDKARNRWNEVGVGLSRLKKVPRVFKFQISGT